MNGDYPYAMQDLIKCFPRIPRQTLRSWVQLGLLEHRAGGEDKRGLKREFTQYSFVQVGLIELLSALGVNLKVIAWIFKEKLHASEDGETVWGDDSLWEIIERGDSLFIGYAWNLLTGIERKYHVGKEEKNATGFDVVVKVTPLAVAKKVMARMQEAGITKTEE